MKNQSLLQEDKRYFNWYHGYTEIKRAYYSYATKQQTLHISTTVTSGNVSTPDFGNKFNSTKIIPAVQVSFVLVRPEMNYKNISLTVECEINQIKRISKGHDRFYIDLELVSDSFVTKRTTFPKTYYPSFRFDRRVSHSDVDKMDMTLMPGFKASWSFSEELKPLNNFSKEVYPQSIMYRK